MDGQRILIAEDDPDSRHLVRRLLERAGAEVFEAGEGSEALRALFENQPQLVILDVGMPEMDGWTALERIRQVSDIPILMLTGLGEELEKVRALRAGADDYVVKPLQVLEFQARVEALLRRGNGSAELPGVYDDGLVSVDFARYEACVEATPLKLTPLEFRLLSVFVRHRNRTLTLDQLLDLVWEDAGLDSRRVKIVVGSLRKKLLAAGASEALITTVRGFGYRYSPPAA
jgi:DNA-binding response OmpR family regulator